MNNPFSISNADSETLKRWVSENDVRTVLEFGPGRSTEVFSGCGCSGLSVEFDSERMPNLDLPLWSVQLISKSKETAERLGVGIEYDLGFIDGPATPSHKWKRFWSLTSALSRCRLVAVHDSIRDAHLISLAEELGSVIIDEDLRERGLALLRVSIPTT